MLHVKLTSSYQSIFATRAAQQNALAQNRSMCAVHARTQIVLELRFSQPVTLGRLFRV